MSYITLHSITMGGSKIVGEKPTNTLVFDFTTPFAFTSTGAGNTGTYIFLDLKLDGVPYDLWEYSGSPGDRTWKLDNLTQATGPWSGNMVSNQSYILFASATYGVTDDRYEVTMNFTADQVKAWSDAGVISFDFRMRKQGVYYDTFPPYIDAFTISAAGNICFLGPTKVKTDQGFIPFNQLTKYNTIDNKKVKKVIQMCNTDDNLIFIKKHAFGKGIPNKNTHIGCNHGIYINDKLVRARNLVNGKTIIEDKREKDIIYNVLLESYGVMYVNNMPCETLNENDPTVWKYI